MTKHDFPFHSTLGFEDLWNSLERSNSQLNTQAFPPFNLLHNEEEDAYRIDMAVAGYSESELSVETHKGILRVTGAPIDREEEGVYLKRGLARRSFTREFRMAETIHVTDVTLIDGILSVYARNEIPEEQKPKSIPIQTKKALTADDLPKFTAGLETQ